MSSTIKIAISFILFVGVWNSPTFVDQAITRGINHSFTEGAQGGGVSFVDFDGDGQDDITLATGSNQEIHFYKNNLGDFVRIDLDINYSEEAKQVLWVDFDNDGDKDFFVSTKSGVNRLFENRGDLHLVDITHSSGLPIEELQSFGAAWGDYNRDGWLDLYIMEIGGNEEPGKNGNRLFRNNANYTFTDVTNESGTNDYWKKPFCASFIDYNNDHWPDIYIANDRFKGNTLLQNNGDGTFSDVSNQTGAGIAMDAMCVNAGDYDNDGWQDIYITNTSSGNALLRNEGMQNENISFEEVADQAGVGFYSIGWGSVFLDSDNDMDLDLYVSGAVVGSSNNSSAFYKNNGDGTFSAPIHFDGDTVSSYANATGDVNGDGQLDIIVSNVQDYPSQLWVNNESAGNFIQFDLKGIKSNRDGIGSLVEIHVNGITQRRFSFCGNSYLGQNSNRIHFGSANYEMVDSAIVYWPSGHIDKAFDLDANQVYSFTEGFSTNGNITTSTGVIIKEKGQRPPFYIESHELLGINHVFKHNDFLGGGVLIFDFNNDGWEDVYLSSGNGQDKFYKNLNGNSFKEISFDAGLGWTSLYYTTGAMAGDINNDGFKDIFVTTKGSEDEEFSKNLLFINNGDESFSEVWAFDGEGHNAFSMGSSFIDFDLDGLLDIYVVNYIEEAKFITDETGNIIGFDHQCFNNKFYRNTGNGEFEDISGITSLNDRGCALAVLASDYDLDGDQDIYVANDFGEFILPNRLFRNNQPSFGFVDLAESLGADAAIYGMGIAAGDYDNDLDIDYYISNLGRNVFLRNDLEHFEDIADENGTHDTWDLQDSILTVGWGTAFLDADNDQDLDLYIANGFVPGPDFIPTGQTNNDRLFINNGNGIFEENNNFTGIVNNEVSRGMAYGDLDNDGKLDIISVVQQVPMQASNIYTKVFMNESTHNNNWVQIILEGLTVNRDAIGSKVYVYAGEHTYLRELVSSSSHCSQNTNRIHLGLGDLDQIDSVIVHWPGIPESQTELNLEINQVHTIVQDTMNFTSGFERPILDDLRIFPNPAKEKIFIQLVEAGHGRISLLTLSGQSILEISSLTFPAELNVSALARGIYILKLETNNGIFLKKLILF